MLYIGLVLGGVGALFGRFVHVASIVENLLATPVGGVPHYIVNSFLSAIERGELGTVLVTLAVASLTAVALWQLHRVRLLPRIQFA